MLSLKTARFNSMKKFLISILTLGVIVGVLFFVSRQKVIAPISSVSCTQEAKLCPDGSSVGRTGPNCEFTECSKLSLDITYTNKQYGFSFSLPTSWKGYKIISGTREIRDVSFGKIIANAPTLSIRHPLWTSRVSRQDIPFDVYTLEQWSHIVTEQYSVSAAPIPPSELARNSKYIFALSARYNYAFPKGYEEVDQILANKIMKTFEPAGTGVVLSGISGTVLLGPICPVMKIPPDPKCADKPYSTSINVMKSGSSKVIKKIQSDKNGSFLFVIEPGIYVLQANSDNVLPRCGEVSVEARSGQYINTEISCDTGIR